MRAGKFAYMQQYIQMDYSGLFAFQNTFTTTNQAVRIRDAADSMYVSKAGMSFTASIDWTRGYFQDGVASDGFYISINQLPSSFNIPIPIPAGMDAVIALSTPVMVTETTGCQSMDNLPRLKYFDSYDPCGHNCQWEKIIDLSDQTLGCKLPAAFFPLNDTCAFEQQFASAMVLAAIDMESLKLSSGKTKFNDQMTNMVSVSLQVSFIIITFAFLFQFNSLQLVGENSQCKPLCSRWTYPVISASYASIQYANQANQERRFANGSWSQIRIILPKFSFIHAEKPRASSYLIVCDIGGMMGVYIGFSMITLAEIFAYGGNILWAKLRKKRTAKVHPQG